MAGQDEQLVGRVLRGDHHAFGMLYDQYAGLVRSICFESTGSIVEAQDLAQEVFLSAFRQLGQLSDRDRFGAWLVGIARLSGKEWRRSRYRDRHECMGDAAGELENPEPLDDSDQWSELQTVLNSLPEEERLAVHLFYLEEQPAQLARKVLNLSLSGFYRVLERARQKLSQRLKLGEHKQ